MITTCGFEEAQSGNKFPHLKRYEQLSYYLQDISELSPESLIATYKNQRIYEADFQSLLPGGWITDSVMAFIYQYLQDLIQIRMAPQRIILVKPRVSHLIKNGKLDDIERFVKDLFHSNFVFLPIAEDIESDDPRMQRNPSAKHWSLFVINTRVQKAFYYNSLENASDATARQIVRRLNVVLAAQYVFARLAAPRQRKGSDCGIIVCEISALLVRRLLRATPGRRLSLGLGETHFVVGAGRSLIQTLLLGLYQESLQPDERGLHRRWSLYQQPPSDTKAGASEDVSENLMPAYLPSKSASGDFLIGDPDVQLGNKKRDGPKYEQYDNGTENPVVMRIGRESGRESGLRELERNRRWGYAQDNELDYEQSEGLQRSKSTEHRKRSSGEGQLERSNSEQSHRRREKTEQLRRTGHLPSQRRDSGSDFVDALQSPLREHHRRASLDPSEHLDHRHHKETLADQVSSAQYLPKPDTIKQNKNHAEHRGYADGLLLEYPNAARVFRTPESSSSMDIPIQRGERIYRDKEPPQPAWTYNDTDTGYSTFEQGRTVRLNNLKNATGHWDSPDFNYGPNYNHPQGGRDPGLSSKSNSRSNASSKPIQHMSQDNVASQEQHAIPHQSIASYSGPQRNPPHTGSSRPTLGTIDEDHAIRQAPVPSSRKTRNRSSKSDPVIIEYAPSKLIDQVNDTKRKAKTAKLVTDVAGPDAAREALSLSKKFSNLWCK